MICYFFKSVTPGVVETPIFQLAGTQKYLEDMKATGAVLNPLDIANGIIYVLSTPPHVQVTNCLLNLKITDFFHYNVVICMF